MTDLRYKVSYFLNLFYFILWIVSESFQSYREINIALFFFCSTSFYFCHVYSRFYTTQPLIRKPTIVHTSLVISCIESSTQLNVTFNLRKLYFQKQIILASLILSNYIIALNIYMSSFFILLLKIFFESWKSNF